LFFFLSACLLLLGVNLNIEHAISDEDPTY